MVQNFRKWLLKLGLWQRMAIGISLGFLALTAAFLVLGERILQETANRLMEERLGFAQLAAGQLDSILAQVGSDLEQARQLADFDPDDPDLSDETLALDHTLSRMGAISPGIFFLDSTGRVLLANPVDQTPPGSDLSQYPAIASVMQNPSAIISEPFLYPVRNRPLAAMLQPIQENGRINGFLGGWFDLGGAALQETLQETASFARTGHSLLLDQQGRVLAASDQTPFLSEGEHLDFYQSVFKQGQPVVETVPVEQEGTDKHNHVMGVAPLENAPWMVAVGGEAEEIFAGISQLRLGIAFLGSIALISIWGLTLLGARALVRPVQNLTEAAERITQGDLHTPLEAPEGGEITALANALEHMRLQLVQHIDELAQSKQTLETRILERTEALRYQQALARQLLRRSIQAQEEERARISSELHDETGQMLTAVQLNLDRLSKAFPNQDVKAGENLDRVRELTEQAVSSLRRIIADLRPGILDQLGLLPALRWIAENTLQPLGVDVTIEALGSKERLSGEIETILFRIAQEAVSNVARHSGATSFCIRLEYQKEKVLMRLEDDGVGFNPLNVAVDPEFKHGLGLAGMQERASLAGGKITIESAPRKGTTVHVEIPIPNEMPPA